MRVRFLVSLTLTVAVLGAGCGASGDDGGVADQTAPSAAPPAGASGFGGPDVAGLCEDADVAIAVEEPAAPTREAAVEEFVEMNSVLEDTTIAGNEITYEGEVVGHLRVREAPAGGYYVATADWCYPG